MVEMDLSGGHRLVEDWMDRDTADSMYARILEEVSFSNMYSHGSEVPRLVAVQYSPLEGGDAPIYRHPSDSSPPSLPLTPCVQELMKSVNERLETRLNHVLIQWYRHGRDYISQHSDKTIDVVPNSIIVNASFGAERVLTLRPKNESSIVNHGEGIQKVVLGNGSLFLLSLPHNAAYTHAIKANKKADRDKTPAELRFSGARISLTFREIGTYLTPTHEIYGVGATSKTRHEAKPIDSSLLAWNNLVLGFGRENRGRVVNVQGYYGHGSDAYR